jgi:hypothetical protein
VTLTGVLATLTGAGSSLTGARSTLTGAGVTFTGVLATLTGARSTLTGAGVTFTGVLATLTGAGSALTGAGIEVYIKGPVTLTLGVVIAPNNIEVERAMSAKLHLARALLGKHRCVYREAQGRRGAGPATKSHSLLIPCPLT